MVIQVSDVARFASEMINAEQILTVIDEREESLHEFGGYELSPSGTRIFQMLIRGINFALGRLGGEYPIFTDMENVVSDSNKTISYSSLTSNTCEIVFVRDVYTNRKVEFYAMPSALYVPKANTEYQVYHRYAPPIVSDFDGTFNVPPYVSPRIVAYALASDLCLSLGNFDESVIWNNRFREAMDKAIVGTKKRFVRMRKFL